MLIAVYARYSSENQSEESITAQLRACEEYASRQGHTIIKTYIDRAQTARSDKREAFQQMIKDSATHGFEAVLVHKLDRFSRDRYDSAIYRKKLKDNGVKLLSVLENIDSSPESIIMESVLEGMAEYYSANLAREVRKGLKERAMECKHTGGIVLYGYKADADGRYIINEEEAAVVRRIFDACYSRTGYNKLLKEFERESIRTRNGKPFTKNAIYYMLKNPRYKGDYVYSPNGEQKNKRCEPIVIKGGVPAIIEPETWDEVQRIMSSRRQNGIQNGKEVYLLSGILVCGKCGKQLYAHRRSKRKKNGTTYVYYTYECSSNTSKACGAKGIKRELIEKAVCEYIQNLLKPTSINDLKRELIEKQNILGNSSVSDTERIQREIKKLDDKISKAVDCLLDDDLPTEVIKQKIADLRCKKEKLHIQLIEAKKRTINTEILDTIIAECINFTELKAEEKKKIIQKIIKKVSIVENDGHEQYAMILPQIYASYSMELLEQHQLIKRIKLS